MSLPKIFKIKESIEALKKLQRSASPFIGKRIQVLIVFKKHESEGISKREVADQVGVNHNSVQIWRSAYIKGGIELLMSHSKKCNIKPIINSEQAAVLRAKLEDPKNGFVGFKELLDWFNKTHQTTINYKTFHGFCVRKFGAKIKTARKSHVKKDEQAVETFKKTSEISVNKPVKKK